MTWRFSVGAGRLARRLTKGRCHFIAEKWTLGADDMPIPSSVTEAGLYVVDVDFANGTVFPSPPRLVVDLQSQLYVDETGMPTRVDDGGRLGWAGTAPGIAGAGQDGLRV